MATDTEFQIGDTVRVGKGKTRWHIVSFWDSANGNTLAQLAAISGFARTSVPLTQLTAESGVTS